MGVTSYAFSVQQISCYMLPVIQYFCGGGSEYCQDLAVVILYIVWDIYWKYAIASSQLLQVALGYGID